jgi:hypothetical protein
MPGLRLLLRVAPFLVGVLAASVWLRRRQAARRPLPAAREVPQIEPARRPEHEPIDIVTVVDDLLLAGR